jgi:hypothetical protein
LKSRHEEKQDLTAAPYRALPSMVGEGPKISLASRHDPKGGDQTPGPNYVPPPLGSDAQKPTMHQKTGTSFGNTGDNPGPGAYDIGSHFANDAVKYTLHQRTNDLTTDQISSPGPAAYTPDYLATKRSATSATLHVRPSDRSLDVTPGPSDYVIDRGLGGVQPTMHQRIDTRQTSDTPGPGAYESQSTQPKAPSYTLKSRHEEKQDLTAAPYRALPSMVGEGPKISLASRHEREWSVLSQQFKFATFSKSFNFSQMQHNLKTSGAS